MIITRRCTFDAAHRLPNHDGKCRKLHGHHYAVDVTIHGTLTPPVGSPDEGMVIDFSAVDVVLDTFVRRFDHQTLLHFLDPLYLFVNDNELWQESGLLGNVDSAREGLDTEQPFGILGLQFVPTAEHLAQYFLDMLTEQNIGVVEVTVHETEKSSATARVVGEGNVTDYAFRKQKAAEAERAKLAG